MSLISLVVPCYRSAGMISELAQSCLSSQAHHPQFELILVDDGSDDETWLEIARQVAYCPKVRGLRLATNHGEHRALWEGYRASRGDYIFSIDDDLQHDPAELDSLLECLLSGAELAYGQHESVHNVLPRRLGSRWNGWVASVLLGRPPGLHLSSFRGISRALLDRALASTPHSDYVDAPLLRHARKVAGPRVSHRDSALAQSRYTAVSLFSLHGRAIRSAFRASARNAQVSEVLP